MKITNDIYLAPKERFPNEPEEAEKCAHVWNNVGTAPDGTAFFECAKCGEESE